MNWWDVVLGWLGDWDGAQGFWTFVQGLGTLLAAVAALVALVIARSQLSELIRSNRLLADSNDAMTHSNISLTRPYVLVDFQYRPFVDRAGAVRSTTITVHIENAGRTPAKNLRMKVDPAFPLPNKPRQAWADGVNELNKVMNGTTVVKSLTNLRPLTYYLDEADDLMGTDENPSGEWRIHLSYEDSEGREFVEESVLELSHWRRAMVTVDPVYRIAKSVQAVAFEVKNKELPSLDIKFPEPRATGRPQIGRPATRGLRKRRRRRFGEGDQSR